MLKVQLNFFLHIVVEVVDFLICFTNCNFLTDSMQPGLFCNHLCHSLINSVVDPLVQTSSKHCQSQTGRVSVLKFWENVHPTLCVRCQVSDFTCHVSPVTCHLSRVRLHKKKIYIYILKKILKLVGGGSVINGLYPVFILPPMRRT